MIGGGSPQWPLKPEIMVLFEFQVAAKEMILGDVIIQMTLQHTQIGVSPDI